MIISASRRTDIPAFFSDWFIAAITAGETFTANPFNAAQVKRVSLLPGDVDGIVFWTKNPAPMMNKLSALSAYPVCFQFTLTPYGPDIEPNLPDKSFIIDTFKRLSETVGPERVIWRYDPVLFNPVFTLNKHLDLISAIAESLEGATRRCVFSFVDTRYRMVKRHAQELALNAPDSQARVSFARGMAAIAKSRGIQPVTCCETALPDNIGVKRAGCIDAALFGLPYRRAAGQRPGCLCAESVDIGRYGTCRHGCIYCYAAG